MRALDGADIRFTDANGNELSYWIESWDYSGRSAKIWVKVSSIPASVMTSIRMYYGNPSTTSSSNGGATFDFFDDASGVYANKWTTISGSANYASVGGKNAINLAENSVIRTSTFTNSGTFILDTDYYGAGEIQTKWFAEASPTTSSRYNVRLDVFVDYYTEGFLVDDTWIPDAGFNSFSQKNTWVTGRVLHWPLNTFSWYVPQGTLVRTITDSKYSSGYLGFSTGTLAGMGHSVTNIKLRKYTSPEPTLTLGAEQLTVPPTTVPPTTVPPTTVPPTTVPPTTVPPTTVPPTTVPPTTVSPTITTPAPPKFRVGPSVTLRPVNDVIEENQDGIVELFMNNPSLNDVTLNVDAQVSVPAGLHVSGENFGESAGAGVVAGTFSVPPGKARTISITIKADKSARTGSHTLQFTGLYYPDGNKDAYQPISLTYAVTVERPSKETPTAIPTATPKEPGFEVILAGIGMILALALRRR